MLGGGGLITPNSVRTPGRLYGGGGGGGQDGISGGTGGAGIVIFEF
jgi:hypothetical protein